MIITIFGGFYAYKRFYKRRSRNVSAHFNNSRSTLDGSRIKMCKLDESIVITPNDSNYSLNKLVSK